MMVLIGHQIEKRVLKNLLLVREQVSGADKKQAEIIKLMQEEDRKQKALRNAKLKMVKAANIIGLSRDMNRSLQIKKKAADDAAKETQKTKKTIKIRI